MSIPSSEPILPEEDNSSVPPRRRRTRRLVIPQGDERSAFLTELVYRLTPSFDFFLFTLISGIILIPAILLDAPALYLLAALFVPFLGPTLGLSFSMVISSGPFLIQSLIATIVGSFFVFAAGAVAGLLSHLFTLLSLQQPVQHTVFSWTSLLLVMIGAGMAVYLLVRSPKQKPLVANVALGYGLYLPAGTAGFGLTSGGSGLWPDGLLVFAVHLLSVILTGMVVLALLGLRPINRLGYGLAGAAALVAAIVIGFSGIFRPVPAYGSTVTETVSVVADETQQLVNAEKTAAPSPAATATITPTFTIEPSRTPTQTITPKPTPLWAKVWAERGNGALIRELPDGESAIIGSLVNGSPVQVVSEAVAGSGVSWVKIITEIGVEGWVVQDLLATATPAPNW